MFLRCEFEKIFNFSLKIKWKRKKRRKQLIEKVEERLSL